MDLLAHKPRNLITVTPGYEVYLGILSIAKTRHSACFVASKFPDLSSLMDCRVKIHSTLVVDDLAGHIVYGGTCNSAYILHITSAATVPRVIPVHGPERIGMVCVKIIAGEGDVDFVFKPGKGCHGARYWIHTTGGREGVDGFLRDYLIRCSDYADHDDQ